MVRLDVTFSDRAVRFLKVQVTSLTGKAKAPLYLGHEFSVAFDPFVQTKESQILPFVLSFVLLLLAPIE